MTIDETVGMSEDERNAFHKGYDDFSKGQGGRGSMSLAQPAAKPPVGLEVPYDKGWRRAEKEGIKEAEKKGHSGECWGYIGAGAMLFLVGWAVTIATFVFSDGQRVSIWFGAIVVGFVLMATGVFKYFFKESKD